MKKLFHTITLLLLVSTLPVAAQQRPAKTFYLSYGFQEIFVNNDVGYVVDRYTTGPGNWTDSVFTVADGYLRQVVQASRQPQGDTLTHTTRWQANGHLQWQEQTRGKHLHGPQLYYDQAGQLRHHHVYVAGSLKSTECVSGGGASQVCQGVETIAPQYPSGLEGLLRYVAQNVHYPLDAVAARKQGKVLVYFVVDETGQVRNVNVKNPVFPSLDAESIRVIKTLARFTPSRKAGLAIPIHFAVPVTFNIN